MKTKVTKEKSCKVSKGNDVNHRLDVIEKRLHDLEYLSTILTNHFDRKLDMLLAAIQDKRAENFRNPLL